MEERKWDDLNLPVYMQTKAAKKAAPPSHTQKQGRGSKKAPQATGNKKQAGASPRPVQKGPIEAKAIPSKVNKAPVVSIKRKRNNAGPKTAPARRRAPAKAQSVPAPSTAKQTVAVKAVPQRTASPKITVAKRKKYSIRPGRLALVLLALLGVGILVWRTMANLRGSTAAKPLEATLNVGTTVQMPRGLTILGVDVGGQTKTAAREAVNAAANAIIANAEVTLMLDHQAYTLSSSDLGLSYDAESVLQQALAKAEETPAVSATPQIVDVTAVQPVDNPDYLFTYNETSLRQALEDIADSFDIEPINAIGEPTLHEDHTVTFAYQEGKDGRAMDIDATIKKIAAAFRSGTYNTTVEGVTRTVNPAVTSAMLAQEMGLRGSYTTQYPTVGATSADTPVVQNRVFNIRKAGEIISGCLVAPDAEWSFNDFVGERSIKNGWKEAKGIVYGKSYAMQAGGGICQVSTTLYNALLQSKIKVTERQAHSIPSDYVDHGLDATVDYPTGLDLKFVNDTGSPMYIFVYYEGVEGRHRERITVMVYGKPLEPGVTYKTRSVISDKKARTDVNQTFDSSIPEGYKIVTVAARSSYKAAVYLDKYVNDEKVDSEYLYTDKYAGNAEEARIGTGDPTKIERPHGAVRVRS